MFNEDKIIIKIPNAKIVDQQGANLTINSSPVNYSELATNIQTPYGQYVNFTEQQVKKLESKIASHPKMISMLDTPYIVVDSFQRFNNDIYLVFDRNSSLSGIHHNAHVLAAIKRYINCRKSFADKIKNETLNIKIFDLFAGNLDTAFNFFAFTYQDYINKDYWEPYLTSLLLSKPDIKRVANYFPVDLFPNANVESGKFWLTSMLHIVGSLYDNIPKLPLDFFSAFDALTRHLDAFKSLTKEEVRFAIILFAYINSKMTRRYGAKLLIKNDLLYKHTAEFLPKSTPMRLSVPKTFEIFKNVLQKISCSKDRIQLDSNTLNQILNYQFDFIDDVLVNDDLEKEVA